MENDVPRLIDLDASVKSATASLTETGGKLAEAEAAVRSLIAMKIAAETRLQVLEELRRNFGSFMGSAADPRPPQELQISAFPEELGQEAGAASEQSH